MSQKLILNPEEINKIIILYNQGLGLVKISQLLKHDRKHIRKILVLNNFSIKRTLTKVNLSNYEQEIVSSYGIGQLNISQLARKYGATVGHIKKILINNNIDLMEKSNQSRKYFVNESFFEVIDSESKAYILGMLLTDGWITKNNSVNKVSLALKVDDVNLLVKIAKELVNNYNDSIIKYRLMGKTRMAGFSLNSVKMVLDLEKHNIVPRKSLIAKPPLTFDDLDLKRHFIRGFFDGDGCISEGKVEIVGTKENLEYINSLIANELGINCTWRHYSKDNKNTFRICLNKQVESVLFLQWLYQDASIYMDRKYQRFLALKSKLDNKENEYANLIKQVEFQVNQNKEFTLTKTTNLSVCLQRQILQDLKLKFYRYQISVKYNLADKSLSKFISYCQKNYV